MRKLQQDLSNLHSQVNTLQKVAKLRIIKDKKEISFKATLEQKHIATRKRNVEMLNESDGTTETVSQSEQEKKRRRRKFVSGIKEAALNLNFKNKAEAVEVLKVASAQLLRAAHIKPMNDAAINDALVTSLKQLLDTTTKRGTVDRIQKMLKEEILAIVAKAADDNKDLDTGIMKRMGIHNNNKKNRLQTNFKRRATSLIDLYKDVQEDTNKAEKTMTGRTERKDKINGTIARRWWLGDGSRFESNKQGTRFCLVEDEDGNEVHEEHTYRTREWSNAAGYNNFSTSPIYTNYLLDGGDPIKLWLFLKMKCTCIIDPTNIACVNVTKQNTIFLFEALRKIVKSPGMQHRLANCSCDKHEFLQIFDGERGMLPEFLKLTLCPKVEVPGLKINEEKYYMFDIDCCRSGEKEYGKPNTAECKRNKLVCKQSHDGEAKCDDCGDLQNFEVCSILDDDDVCTNVSRFIKVEREDGSLHEEVKEERLSASQILKLIRLESPCYISNKFEIDYFERCVKKMKATLGPYDLVVGHDFAATTKINKKYGLCCEVPNCVVMEAYIVTHSRRLVTIPRHTKDTRRRTKNIKKSKSTIKGGDKVEKVEEQTIEVFTTDAIFFWVASRGKKENDWSNGNQFLDYITKMYRDDVFKIERADEGKGMTDMTMYELTDAAPTQYKCKQKQIKNAGFAKKHGVRKIHIAAPKYGFKGPWDALNRVARQKASDALLRGECVVTNACEFAMKSSMECKTPTTVWGEGTDEKSYRHRKPGTIDSYTHVMAAPSEAIGTKYRQIIADRKNRLDENEHDKEFELDVLVVPKEKYDCTGIPGIAELYNFHGRNAYEEDELWLRRRCCICKPCREADPTKPLGHGCTSNIPGPYRLAPPMVYKTGNNVASVTRTISEEREERREQLKVGTLIATIRETQNTTLLNQRCYEISRITKKPTRSDGKIKDYSNKKIRKGTYYIKVDDFKCLPDTDDKSFRKKDTAKDLGMICVCKPGDDMFYNCDIVTENSSSNGDSFRISDTSHDNIQGMYQASRELVSGLG